jgi:hypothetical protein
LTTLKEAERAEKADGRLRRRRVNQVVQPVADARSWIPPSRVAPLG